MSDFYRDATTPVARKQYVCIACGWFIPQGERHHHQTGVFDGAGFSNRFHDECWSELVEDRSAHEDEFITGNYPVPERFKADAEPYWAAKRAAAMIPKEPAMSDDRELLQKAAQVARSMIERIVATSFESAETLLLRRCIEDLALAAISLQSRAAIPFPSIETIDDKRAAQRYRWLMSGKSRFDVWEGDCNVRGEYANMNIAHEIKAAEALQVPAKRVQS